MLAKRFRLTEARDYQGTVRRGRRLSSDLVIVYFRSSVGNASRRYGFVVSRAVGNAVIRNLVRRRLKSIALQDAQAAVSSDLPPPRVDVVIRALPAAAQADWDTLRADVAALLSSIDGVGNRGMTRPRLAGMVNS